MPAFTTGDEYLKQLTLLDLPSKMPAFTTFVSVVAYFAQLDLPSKMPAFTTLDLQPSTPF